MKNGVFWVVTPCGSCKNRRFGGTWRLLHQGDKRATLRNNPEDTILHSHRRENLKSYEVVTYLPHLKRVRFLVDGLHIISFSLCRSMKVQNNDLKQTTS
jgi:hypothetical protein